MEWSDQEMKELTTVGCSTRQRWSSDATIKAIASKAVELVAARGGTMTADELREDLATVGTLAHRAPISLDRLRQHISAQGARVAVLEAEKDRLLADWREYKASKDADVAQWKAERDAARDEKANLEEANRLLNERRMAAEGGNRELVRRAQQAETLLGHAQRNCESWRLMADRMRIRYEEERKRADALSTAGQDAGDIEAYGLLKTGADARYPQRHPHAFAPNEHGLCGARVVGGHGACGYAAHQHRYPCSPACTHDDARTPGHPERVKERSEAFTAEDINDQHIVSVSSGYDAGAEAMRAACWEALQRHLRKNGYAPEVHPAAWDGFKSAIEGATP